MDMQGVMCGSVAGAMVAGYALEKRRQEQRAVDDNINEWKRYANSIKAQVKARDREIDQLKADIKAQSVSTRVMHALYEQLVAETKLKTFMPLNCLDKKARCKFMMAERDL